jgi:RNA polymerase-binding transcription factor DksA
VPVDAVDPRAVRSTAERLAAALDEAQRSVADLERSHDEIVAASRDTNADDEHDPEGATIAFEREQVTALLVQARHRVDELRSAVERSRTGAYGRCERCGGPVGAARLEARPTARTCIACASVR